MSAAFFQAAHCVWQEEEFPSAVGHLVFGRAVAPPVVLLSAISRHTANFILHVRTIRRHETHAHSDSVRDELL
jgi:hypothetical protein